MLINRKIEIGEDTSLVSGSETGRFFIPNITNKEINNIILPVYSFEVKTSTVCIMTDIVSEIYKNEKVYLYDGNKYEKLEILDISNIQIRVKKTINLINILNSINRKYIVIIIKDIFLDNKRVIELKNKLIFDKKIFNYAESYLGLKYKDTWPFNSIDDDAYRINKSNHIGIKKVETDLEYKNIIIYSKYKENTDENLFDLKTTIYRENVNLNYSYNKIIGISLKDGKLIRNLVGDEVRIGKIREIKIKEGVNINFNNFLKTCIKINNRRFYDFHKIRGKLKKIFIVNSGHDYEINPRYKIIPKKIDYRYKEPKLKFIVKDGKIIDCIIKNPGDYIIGDIDILVFNKHNLVTAEVKGIIEGNVFDFDYNVLPDEYEKINEIVIEQGSGAILKPIIRNGKIISVNIVNPGKGYFNTPKLEVISDTGSGAFLYVESLHPDGGIKSVSILSSGRGYKENRTKINLINLNIEKIIEDINLEKYNLIHSDNDEKYYRIEEDFNLENHGKLVGISLDGFPIYIGVGYSNPMDSNSPLKILTPSYKLETNPSYLENLIQKYVFDGNGDLDEYNGRFCVTPEFPNGTYAYFITKFPPFYPLKLRYSVREINSGIPIFKDNKIDKKIDFSYKNNLLIKNISLDKHSKSAVGDFIKFKINNNNYSYGEVYRNTIKNIDYEFYTNNVIRTKSNDRPGNKYLLRLNPSKPANIIVKFKDNKICVLDGVYVETEKDYSGFFYEDVFIEYKESPPSYKNFMIFYSGIVQDPEDIIYIQGNNVIIKNVYDRIYFVNSSSIYKDVVDKITNKIPKLNYPSEILFINGVIQKNYEKNSEYIILSEDLMPNDKIQIYYFDYQIIYSNKFDSNGYLLDNYNNIIEEPGYVFYHFINGVFSNEEINFNGTGYKLKKHINYLDEDNYFVGIKYSGVALPNNYFNLQNFEKLNYNNLMIFYNGILQNPSNIVYIHSNDDFIILEEYDKIYYIDSTYLNHQYITKRTNKIHRLKYIDELLFINGVLQTNYEKNNNNIILSEDLCPGDEIHIYYFDYEIIRSNSFNSEGYLIDSHNNLISHPGLAFYHFCNGVFSNNQIKFDGIGYRLNNYQEYINEINHFIGIKYHDILFMDKIDESENITNLGYNNFIFFYDGIYQPPEEIVEFNDGIPAFKGIYDSLCFVDSQEYQNEEINTITNKINTLNYRSEILFVNGVIQKNYEKNTNEIIFSENLYPGDKINIYYFDYELIQSTKFNQEGYLIDLNNNIINIPNLVFYHFINGIFSDNTIYFDGTGYKLTNYLDYINEDNYFIGVRYFGNISLENNSFINKNTTLFFVNNVLQKRDYDFKLIKINDEYKFLPKNIREEDYYYSISIKNSIRVEFTIKYKSDKIYTINENFLLFINGLIQTDFSYNRTTREIILYENVLPGDVITLFYNSNEIYHNLIYDSTDGYIKKQNYTKFNIPGYNFIIVVNGIIQEKDKYEIIYDNSGYKLINPFISKGDVIKIIAIKDITFYIPNLKTKTTTRFYIQDENLSPVINDSILFLNGVIQENVIYGDDSFYLNKEINKEDNIILYKLPGHRKSKIKIYNGYILNNVITFIDGVIQLPGSFCSRESVYVIIPEHPLIWNLSIVENKIYDNDNNKFFSSPGYGFMIFINNIIQDVDIKFLNNQYIITNELEYNPNTDKVIIIGIKNLEKFKVNLNEKQYIDLENEKIIYLIKPHKIYFKKPIKFISSCNYEENSEYFIIDSNKNHPGIYEVFIENTVFILSICTPPVYALSERIENDKILIKKTIIPNKEKYFNIDLINLSDKSNIGECAEIKILNKNINYFIEDSSNKNIWIEHENCNGKKVVRKYLDNKIIPTNIPIYYCGAVYLKIEKNLDYLDTIEIEYKNETLKATVIDTRFKEINIYGIEINKDIIIDGNKITNVEKII